MSFHPQTPQSPSQSSPISSVGISSNIHNLSGSLSSSFASSSSGAHAALSTQSNQIPQGSGSQTTQTTQSTLPTPAHSVNGSGLGSGSGPGSGSLDPNGDMSALLNDDSPHKRKRLLDDVGEQDLKKAYMEGQQRLDFEALHQDVGTKYLVCQKSHEPMYPPLSEDLYALFNLNGIAAEVARTLPNGEKNAMRKTYKGYMKKLGVSGHFEPAKREPGDEGDFMALLAEPEDSWQARQVKTKDIRHGLEDDVLASLRAAMTINKGPLPKAVWDNSVLGSDVPPLGAGVNGGGARGSSAARGTAPNTPLHPAALARSKAQSQYVGSPGGATVSASGAASADARPRRMNKKRSYNDNSFEGYNETYDEEGYSTGGDNGDGPSHKRRKKNGTPTTQYSTAPVRQQSYGPGMVGA